MIGIRAVCVLYMNEMSVQPAIALAGVWDAEHLTVFGHRAPRNRQALRGQHGSELLVAVCRAGRLGGNQSLQTLQQLIQTVVFLIAAGTVHKKRIK